MNIKKLILKFGTVFGIALAITAMVTLLWNLIGHGESIVDWETSFRFAVIFYPITAAGSAVRSTYLIYGYKFPFYITAYYKITPIFGMKRQK
jgi:hypothetical protein